MCVYASYNCGNLILKSDFSCKGLADVYKENLILQTFTKEHNSIRVKLRKKLKLAVLMYLFLFSDLKRMFI